MSSEIVIPAELILPKGLVGMPGVRLLDVAPVDETVVELVDPVEPGFGFFAAAGEDVRPGLTADLAQAGHAGPGDAVLVLLSITGTPASITANLAGPIVVAPDGTARQVVLEGADHLLRFPVPVGQHAARGA